MLGFVLSHVEMVTLWGFAVVSLCVDVIEFLGVFLPWLALVDSSKAQQAAATLTALSEDLIHKTSDTSLK